MPRWTALLCLLALVLIPARPTLAAEAPVTQADQDWEAYQAASRQEPEKPWEELSPLEEGEFIEGIHLANRQLGLPFLTNHPSDPRRWKIVAEFTAKHSTSHFALYFFVSYAMPFEECEFGKHIDEWKAFASNPNAKIAKFAAARLAFYELTKNPLEIAFTSVDERPVDLGQLRGKVVPVDFWATWCPPCVAGLPKVAKLYEEYRARTVEGCPRPSRGGGVAHYRGFLFEGTNQCEYATSSPGTRAQ